MITDKKLIEEFERKLKREEKVDYKKNFMLMDAMYQEAFDLKVFPLKNPLDGLEIDIKIAKVINSVRESS